MNTTAMDILELNREVCRRLWTVKKKGQIPSALSPHLIVPEYKTGSSRISEQEARFLYTETLASSSYYYSVETPTQGSYCFAGQGDNSRSAQSDITLYRVAETGLESAANVELKAHNAEPEAIRKDIVKLLCEPFSCSGLQGNWVHLLSDTNRGTLPALFDKFKEALSKIIPAPSAEPLTVGKICESLKGTYFPSSPIIRDCPLTISIVFTFCILGTEEGAGWACLKHFHYPEHCENLNDYLISFFPYISGQKPDDDREYLKDHGWEIFRERNN